VYIAIPILPRLVISLANVSSAVRREAWSFIMTTATTFAPLNSSGVASGAFQDEVNVAAHADSVSTLSVVKSLDT
jgi:hypothetical protein